MSSTNLPLAADSTERDSSARGADATPASIQRQLRRLRGSMTRWLVIDGLARVLLIGLALVFLDLVVDWYFRMDVVQRRWMLAIVGIALLWTVYKRLIRPLSGRLDDDALCLEVEARHPELGQSLISAVQLARLNVHPSYTAERGVSPTMVRATIDEGVQRAGTIDFRDVLDDFEFRRNVLLLLLAIAVWTAIVAGVLLTDPLQIWFNRNVMLGAREWPQATELVIVGVSEDNTLSLPRGDDWLQVVRAEKAVPSLVYLDYQPVRGSRTVDQMKQVGDREFQTTFKNMLDEFEFRVRGGDDYSPWIKVTLVDRPAVEELELVVAPPAYTKLEAETLPPGAGPYPVLKGSALTVRGRANKPLSEATLFVGEQQLPATILADGRFELALPAEQVAADAYRIELTDTVGLVSKRPSRFAFRTKPDREPTVRARLEGISGMIVPGARVPIVMTVQDDFAITDARLKFQWRADADNAGSSGQLEFETLRSRFGKPRLEHRYAFETGPLGLPVGANLSFFAQAIDNDNVSSAPGESGKPGKSDNFLLRVVTEEELRADLLRREKERRLDVEHLLKDQEDLQTETRSILAAIRGGALPAEQRSALMKAQKRQFLASDRLQLVARQLAQLILEVENNRLEETGGAVQRRLQTKIIEPLEALAAEPVPRAARHLDDARRQATEFEARDEQLALAADQQERIIRDLREVLRHMAKSEGYQEAINLLYAILKSQGEVNEITLREAQKSIESIFEDSE